MYKNLFTLLVFIVLLSVNAQKSDLEFYTLDEATQLIQEQNSGSYGCRLPFYLLCQSFSIFRINDVVSTDIPIPYISVADIDKIHAHMLPDLQATAKVRFWKYSNHWVSNQENRERLLESSNVETWEEYQIQNYQRYYWREAQEALREYSNGFVIINKEGLVRGYSALKGESIEWSFYFFSDTQTSTSFVSQSEAKKIFEGEATLVATLGSLFSETKQEPDEWGKHDLIWVFEDKAIGLTTQQLYQIVDEQGNPLNLLIDEVETLITDETLASTDIETFKIRVMFDLVPVDEF